MIWNVAGGAGAERSLSSWRCERWCCLPCVSWKMRLNMRASNLLPLFGYFRDAERRAAEAMDEVGRMVNRKHLLTFLSELNDGYLDPDWNRLGLDELERSIQDTLASRFYATPGGNSSVKAYNDFREEIRPLTEDELRMLLDQALDHELPQDSEGNPCDWKGLGQTQLAEIWRMLPIPTRQLLRERLKQQQNSAIDEALKTVTKGAILVGFAAATGALAGAVAGIAGSVTGGAVAGALKGAVAAGTAVVISGMGTPEEAGACPVEDDTNRENKVREDLKKKYEQILGEKDGDIRKNLDLPKNSSVADFVGCTPDGKWLIAEVKGSDLDKAMKQLETTADAIIKKLGVDASNIELQIYAKSEVFDQLSTVGLRGRFISKEGYLMFYDQINSEGQAVLELANGIKVKVLSTN